ncbi:nuclear transport factor 2 family protein [Jatrophihabitans sp. YIM 134969]
MPGVSAEALLERMVQDVFNQPDAGQRASAVDEVFTADVVFVDGERTVTGRNDLAATVTALLARAPGFVFVPDGPFRGVGDLGMRPWRLGPPGGDPVLRGLDVVQVADGAIARLWTVLGD